MKIAVLIKSIPKTKLLKIDSSETWIDDSNVQYVMNEHDTYALEEAVLIKEKLDNNSEVIAITMGPKNRSNQIIQEALAKGADSGIIIEKKNRITDPLAFAKIFSEQIKDQKFDLIICGLASSDLGSGQTSVLIGELLGMTTATFAIDTDIKDGSIKVKKELESGYSQWIDMSLPASISVQSGLNNPRYSSIKNVMNAKNKKVVIKKVDQDVVTMQGFTKFFVPKNKKKTEFIEGNIDVISDKIISIFKENLKLIK